MLRDDIKNQILGVNKKRVDGYETSQPISKQEVAPMTPAPMSTPALTPTTKVAQPYNVWFSPWVSTEAIQQIEPVKPMSVVIQPTTEFDQEIKNFYEQTTNKSIDEKWLITLKNTLATKWLLGYDPKDIDFAKFLIDSNAKRGEDPMFKVDTSKVLWMQIPLNVDIMSRPALRESAVKKWGVESLGVDYLDAFRSTTQNSVISQTYKWLLNQARDFIENPEIPIGIPWMSQIMPWLKAKPIVEKLISIMPPKRVEKLNNFFTDDAPQLQYASRFLSDKLSEAIDKENKFIGEFNNTEYNKPRQEWRAPIESTKDERLKDPAFRGYTAVSMLPYTLVALVASRLWWAWAVMWTFYPSSYEWVYEDMKKNWASEEVAQLAGKAWWMAIAAIEGIFDEFQFSKIPLFKNFIKEEAPKLITKAFGKIIKEGITDFAKIIGSENIEELAQQAIQDWLVKLVNNDRKILDGYKNIIATTTIATLPMAILWWGGKIYGDMKNYTDEQFQKDLQNSKEWLKNRVEERKQAPLWMAVIDVNKFKKDVKEKVGWEPNEAQLISEAVKDVNNRINYNSTNPEQEAKYQEEANKWAQMQVENQDKITEAIQALSDLEGIKVKPGIQNNEIWSAGKVLRDFSGLTAKYLPEKNIVTQERVSNKARNIEKMKEEILRKIDPNDTENAHVIYDRLANRKQINTETNTRTTITDQITAFYEDWTMPENETAKKFIQQYSENPEAKIKYNGVDYTELQDELIKKTYITEKVVDNTLPWENEPKKYNSAIEAMQDPEYKRKMAEATKKMNAKITKTSNNLYHTTSIENLDSIKKEWLTPWKKQRFEWVWSSDKISFGANEKTAEYYWKEWDVMLRTKAWFKPTTLDVDLLWWWEGTYTVSEKIPPEMLEVKIKGKRQPLMEQTKEPAPKKENKAPTQERINRATEMLKWRVKEQAKGIIAKKLKGTYKENKWAIDAIARGLAYQPSTKDYKEIYSDPALLDQARDMMFERGMIEPEVMQVFNDIMGRLYTSTNKGSQMQSQRWYLTNMQKFAFNQWDQYKTPIRGKLEDIKIKTLPIIEFLKTNPEVKIDVVETPKSNLTKPFAMMGTKEKTFGKLMATDIYKAVRQGQEIYNEPFSWVGTSLHYLPSIFKAGLKQANLNFFDIEKYTIINALKLWELNGENLYHEINTAYKKIIDQITTEMRKDPEINAIFEDAKNAEVRNDVGMLIEGEYISDQVKSKEAWVDVELGTKLFQQTMEVIGFYPELAKEFFKETIDSKLAVKWDITETFKNWLENKLDRQIKEKSPDLTSDERKQAVLDKMTEILDSPQLFEGKYATLSKNITDILDAYDNDRYVSNIKTPQEALLVATSRHMRQRGTSGQRMIAPSQGFSVTENTVNKMYNWLDSYRKTLETYGEKINIENMDGKEFIQKYSKGEQPKQIWYLDPPYVRITNTYIHNNPALSESLGEYADPKLFKNILDPIKGAGSVMLTNDVDGNYFQAVKDVLGSNMGDHVLAYKEWLTPTSYITTANINNTPNGRGMLYYQLNKNEKIQNAIDFKAMEMNNVGSWLKKNLAKFMTYATQEAFATSEELTKIKEGIEKGQMQYEKLIDSIESMTSWRDKQEIMKEAKKLARKGAITWDPLIKIIDMINRYMDERKQLLGKVKDLRKKILSPTIQAQTRARLQEFLDEYNFQRPDGEAERMAEQLNKWDFLMILEYYSDPRIQAKIDQVNKISIYSLANEELVQMRNKVIMEVSKGKDELTEYKNKEQEIIDNKIKENTEKVYRKDYKIYSDQKEIKAKTNEDITISELMRKRIAKTKRWAQELIDQVTMTEQLAWWMNMSQLKWDFIDNPVYEYETIHKMFRDKYLEWKKILENKYWKFNKADMENIGKYWLAMKDKGMWIPSLIAYYEKEMRDKWKEINMNIITKIIEDIQNGETLIEKTRELYKLIQWIYKENADHITKTYEQEENKLFVPEINYRPVKTNWNAMPDIPIEIRDEISLIEQWKWFKKTSIQKWFTKEAKWAKIIPIMDAEILILKHIDETLYYAMMQEPIRRLTKIIKGMWMERLGDRGYQNRIDMISTISKKWNINTENSILWKRTEEMISWVKKSYLTFRAITWLMQTTDIAMTFFMTWRVVIPEFFQWILSHRAKDIIRNNSQELNHRVPRDPIITRPNILLKRMGTTWHNLDEAGMWLVRNIDYQTWSAIFLDQATLQLTKIWKTWETATAEEKRLASQIGDARVRKILWDASFKWMAKYLLQHKGIHSLYTTLQTFGVNRLSLLTEENQKRKFTKERTGMVKVVMWLAVVALIEMYMRRLYRTMRGKDNTKSAFWERISTIFWNIPFVWPAFDVMSWQDTILSDPMTRIFNGKLKSETGWQYLAWVVVSLMMLLGIAPGMLQIKELMASRLSWGGATARRVRKVRSTRTRRRR